MSDYLAKSIKKRLEEFKERKARYPQRAENQKYYGCCGWPGYYTDIGCPSESNPVGKGPPGWPKGCQMIERPPGRKTFCDKIVRIDHKGWYTNSNQDDVTRGVVIQLSTRHGEEQYLSACTDPWNFGPLLVDVMNIVDDKDQAARNADQLAKNYAEDLREDDAKQQAEYQIEDAKENIKTLRGEIESLIIGIRKSILQDVVCLELKASIKRKRRNMHKAWKRIEELKDNYWNAVSP